MFYDDTPKKELEKSKKNSKQPSRARFRLSYTTYAVPKGEQFRLGLITSFIDWKGRPLIWNLGRCVFTLSPVRETAWTLVVLTARRDSGRRSLLDVNKSRVRIPWGTLVARDVRGGQFGWSHPVSLSGEDSCFVVMWKGQKGVFPTGPPPALILV